MAVSIGGKSPELVYLEKLNDHELIYLYLLGPSPYYSHNVETNRSEMLGRLLQFISQNNFNTEWCNNTLKENISISEINKIVHNSDSIKLLCFLTNPFHVILSINLEQLAYISVNLKNTSQQDRESFLQHVVNMYHSVKNPPDLKFVTEDKKLKVWLFKYIQNHFAANYQSQLLTIEQYIHTSFPDINKIEAKMIVDYLIRTYISACTTRMQQSTYSAEDKQRLYELERRDLVVKLKSAYTRRKSRTNKDKETKEFSFTMNKSIEKKLSELSAHEGKTKSAIIEELLTKAYRTLKKKPSVLGED